MAAKRVVATGVFDLLHPGHVHFLARARELGDELVVVVAHDDTARRLKRATVVPAVQRAEMVAQLKPVDRAVVGRDGDLLAVVEELRPQVIALGHDQRLFETDALEARLAERGLAVRVERLPQLTRPLAGSRRLITRVLEIHGGNTNATDE